MRYSFGLILLVTVPFAAADPIYPVPQNWPKLADATGGTHITARDDYVVWVTKDAVPMADSSRGKSFNQTVYRLKGGDRPEQLEQRKTPYDLVALAGPKGAVATGISGQCDTVHIPDHKPLSLPKGRLTAHHFTADGLVCSDEVSRENKHFQEIVFFPIDRVKGTVGGTRVLRSVSTAAGPDGFKPDFTHGRVFVHGDFVAYAGTLPNPTGRAGATRPAIEVWDWKNQRVVWREDHAALESADDTHAYWSPGGSVVARRALDGSTGAEQVVLSKDVVQLDLQPPQFYALVNRNKERTLTRVDLSTGARTEFDLHLPHAAHVLPAGHSGPVRAVTVSMVGARLQLAFDPTTGAVRAMNASAVYTVPAAGQLPGEKVKWEPLMRK
jgi:hypothetical protein